MSRSDLLVSLVKADAEGVRLKLLTPNSDRESHG